MCAIFEVKVCPRDCDVIFEGNDLLVLITDGIVEIEKWGKRSSILLVSKKILQLLQEGYSDYLVSLKMYDKTRGNPILGVFLGLYLIESDTVKDIEIK